MSKISEDRVEALAAACAEKVKQLEFSVKQSAFDSVRQELETELAIARVALLALRERAEPVAWIAAYHGEVYDDITGLTRSAVESYAAKYGWEAALTEITPLYTAPPAPVVPEWTNQQCLEFLAVAFRHAEIKGDFELDDLRLGVKMANAMTPGKEG